MSEDEATEFERTVLARCCPEVGFHRDGTPDYARLSAFECPCWVRTPSSTAAKPAPAKRARLAPSAVRSPISRVRRATLTDIREKIPAAERNSPRATTPAIAPACGSRFNSARQGVDVRAPDGTSGPLLDVVGDRDGVRLLGAEAQRSQKHEELKTRRATKVRACASFKARCDYLTAARTHLLRRHSSAGLKLGQNTSVCRTATG